jgi:lipoate---protein ligase
MKFQGNFKLQNSESFKAMKWRVVPLAEQDAFMNMAIDESVSESIAGGQVATIRFYRWKPSAVSIGCFQSMRDEVDVEKCKSLGVDVIRRRTGGGAVYHDNKGEITYSVIVPEKLLNLGITESYHVICGWIVDSLAGLGIKSEFKPINDIIAGGKKISGNAQTRRNGVVLQHGTILYDVDVDTMFSLLKVPDEKIRDKMIAAVKERVTRVLDFTDVSQEQVYEALVKGFTEGKEWEFGSLTYEEKKRAEELVEKRYKTEGWNFKR